MRGKHESKGAPPKVAPDTSRVVERQGSEGITWSRHQVIEGGTAERRRRARRLSPETSSASTSTPEKS